MQKITETYHLPPWKYLEQESWIAHPWGCWYNFEDHCQEELHCQRKNWRGDSISQPH